MDKGVKVIEHGEVYKKPDLIFGFNAWPSIARAHNGDLAVVFSGNRLRHVCPFGKVLMVRSRDEGKTWSAPAVVLETPLDDRDAGIITLPGGGMAITSFNNTRELQARWVENRALVSAGSDTLDDFIMSYLPAVSDETEAKYLGSLMSISCDDGFSFGEPFKVPVSAPHGPNILKDGTLIYAGRPYGSLYTKTYNEEYPIWICKSKNYSDFEVTAKIRRKHPELKYCEPYAIELPNGRIIIHIRVQEIGKASLESGVFTILQSVSDDGGKTFTPPEFTGATGSPPHLMLHSSGVLVCSYGRRRPPYGIHAMISRDNGDTWDVDYFLWDKAFDGDLGYPASIELSNGDILTVYYAKLPGQKGASIMWTRWRLPE